MTVWQKLKKNITSDSNWPTRLETWKFWSKIQTNTQRVRGNQFEELKLVIDKKEKRECCCWWCRFLSVVNTTTKIFVLLKHWKFEKCCCFEKFSKSHHLNEKIIPSLSLSLCLFLMFSGWFLLAFFHDHHQCNQRFFTTH